MSRRLTRVPMQEIQWAACPTAEIWTYCSFLLWGARASRRSVLHRAVAVGRKPHADSGLQARVGLQRRVGFVAQHETCAARRFLVRLISGRIEPAPKGRVKRRVDRSSW